MICPYCYEEGFLEELAYTPEQGLDPHLKEYHCLKCDTYFYVIKRKNKEKIEEIQCGF